MSSPSWKSWIDVQRYNKGLAIPQQRQKRVRPFNGRKGKSEGNETILPPSDKSLGFELACRSNGCRKAWRRQGKRRLSDPTWKMPWRLSIAQEASRSVSMLWMKAVHESFGTPAVSLSLFGPVSSDYYGLSHESWSAGLTQETQKELRGSWLAGWLYMRPFSQPWPGLLDVQELRPVTHSLDIFNRQ